VTKQYGPEDIERVRHADYVEAISKHSGGKVEWFECPHCAIIFDAFGNAQLALDTCVAQAKTCERRA
jgi:hypothetical protein